MSLIYIENNKFGGICDIDRYNTIIKQIIVYVTIIFDSKMNKLMTFNLNLFLLFSKFTIKIYKNVIIRNHS